MRLANLQEFRRLIYTTDSAPAVNTLRAMINANQLPGGMRMGKRYYVDMDAFDAATGLRQGIEARMRQLLEENPDLKDIL